MTVFQARWRAMRNLKIGVSALTPSVLTVVTLAIANPPGQGAFRLGRHDALEADGGLGLIGQSARGFQQGVSDRITGPRLE